MLFARRFSQLHIDLVPENLENAISQARTAVKSFEKKSRTKRRIICFCVGNKHFTIRKMIKCGQMTKKCSESANFIVKDKSDTFQFFLRVNLRRDEFLQSQKKKKLILFEVKNIRNQNVALDQNGRIPFLTKWR
jgi:hypothetical protein